MEKAKKINSVTAGIIELQKKIVPEVSLKNHFSKKLIKSIPSSVISAHLACDYRFEDSPLQDPLLFLIPMFAQDPYVAAAQLVNAISEKTCAYNSNPKRVNEELDKFMDLLESMESD